MEIEDSNIYYSTDHNDQVQINSDRSSQAETWDHTKTGEGFRETRELRDSRRRWMIVSVVLLMVTLLSVCLTFYFAYDSSEHDSGTVTGGAVVESADAFPCASSPCQNGGYCVTTGCSYHCECPDGFSGHHCQETPCSTSPCLNGGTCSIENSTYSCQCLRGFIGSECQDAFPCASSPCQNGGYCVTTGCSYHCECPDGFSGHHCQETPCSTSPCLNGGTCSIENSTYSCQCLRGFIGSECQDTPCSDQPCMNNGACHVTGNTYSCVCSNGYNGTRCEMKICSSGWIQYDGRCFYLSVTKMSWFEAKRYCGNHHGTLAEPKTKADINFLKTEAKARGFTFWIGGTDAQNEGEWIWESSKTRISETDWHTRTNKQPSNSWGNEDCLNIHTFYSDFEWNDAGCGSHFRFICEKK